MLYCLAVRYSFYFTIYVLSLCVLFVALVLCRWQNCTHLYC